MSIFITGTDLTLPSGNTVDTNTTDIGTITGRVLTDVPSNAVFTDTLTPVVDNLTSTSTTDALTANQGKVLKDTADSLALTSLTSNHYAGLASTGYTSVVTGDLNNSYKNGRNAFVKADVTNAPTDMGLAGYLEVYGSFQYNETLQIVYNNDGVGSWSRTEFNNVWSPWEKITASNPVSSNTTEVGTSQILNMVQISQANYDLLTPDANTFYVIVG